MARATLHEVAVRVLTTCWCLFGIIWLLGALYNTARGARGLGPSWANVKWAVTAFVLALVLRAGFWSELVVQSGVVIGIGLGLLLGGTVLAVWSRVTLGTMWSSSPMLQTHHELYTDGPYRITRHPIYTAILAMLMGTTMIFGFGRWVVVMLAGAIFVLSRIRVEKQLMMSCFTNTYALYRQRVPQVIPA